MISDPDSDVSHEATRAVSKVKLIEENLEGLKVLLSNGVWQKRSIAAGLISQVQSKVALDILVKRLSIETDNDVKHALATAIAAIKI